MHGIDNHDVGREALQQFAGVAVQQGHTRDSGGDLGLVAGCGGVQSRPKAGVDLGRTLDERHLRAKRGEQEGVAAEACGRIDNGWGDAAREARGAGQILAASAPEAKAMADRAADEVDGQVLRQLVRRLGCGGRQGGGPSEGEPPISPMGERAASAQPVRDSTPRAIDIQAGVALSGTIRICWASSSGAPIR